jgi:kumamolisin
MKPLEGSQRASFAGTRDVGPADGDERLQVSVLLRRRNAAELAGRVRRLQAGDKRAGHLSRQNFAASYGADPAEAAAVASFAQAHALTVVSEDLARRTVVLAGTVARFEAAFAVALRRLEFTGGACRGRTGPIHLPQELSGVIVAVLGPDDRPQAKTHFRLRREGGAAATSFTPAQIAALYDFAIGSGAGECIALIELGGGYRTADLATYFAANSVAPAPSVAAVSVDGAQNSPTGAADGPDGEVMLDIEVAGSIAPGAGIAVYFAPNTDAGFIDAVTTAAHDETHEPSVISISWGGPESTWTSQATTALDEALQAAAVMGVTVCVAAGGSSDGVADGQSHVDFPASRPHALGCGGTKVEAAAGAIVSETVWNEEALGDGATGGGVSAVFALPSWQSGLETTSAAGVRSLLTRRGVPDVCGDADPQTGYSVRVDGADTVIGGTSAVAPLWAGLIARINANKGAPVGFINPEIYAHGSDLNDITQGDNGAFAAGVGWDACTGLGSPNGTAIASTVTSAAAG